MEMQRQTPSIPWEKVETWEPPRQLGQNLQIGKIHINIANHCLTGFSFSYATNSSYKMHCFAKLKFVFVPPGVNWNLWWQFVLSVFAHTTLRERRLNTHQIDKDKRVYTVDKFSFQ